MGIAVSSLFYSCSNETELENENSQEFKTSLSARDSKVCEIFDNATESSIIQGVKGVHLENGISTACEKNILIFPSLQTYGEAIVKLDELIENHNDAFDQQTANMTDVEADDYADAIGFDENQPLSDFEDELKFCSLRKHIEPLEDAWLAQQTDGAWNISASPDDHFIDDETERALLSLGSEFIIGDCKNGYTLYKRYDWGFVSFPIDDVATTNQILSTLNNLPNPGQVTSAQVGNALAPYKGSVNYNITNNSTPSTQTNCRGVVKDKGEHIFSSERRIKWKHKLKDTHFPIATGNTLMKTYTKSYRKKKGRWKKYRATIFTGYQGKTSSAYTCNDYGTEPLEGQEKRRIKVKDRSYLIGDLSVKQNVFFSVHKQEGNYYQNEVY